MFGYGPMMGGWGYGNGLGGWGMGAMGMIFPLVILIGVVYIIYHFLSRSGRNRGFGTQNFSRANEILAERFARGEISEEEYKRLKNLL